MLASLERKIMELTKDAKVVHMTQFLDTFINNHSIEFIQNTVRDLVNRDILIMKQNPVNHDWYYSPGFMLESSLNKTQD
jgi:hypothetical protein